MTDMQEIFELVDQLPRDKKRQLLRRLKQSLDEQKTSSVSTRRWRDSLRATYGILADDPIVRPPQPPLENREPIE
jgi:hypothetical protein